MPVSLSVETLLISIYNLRSIMLGLFSKSAKAKNKAAAALSQTRKILEEKGQELAPQSAGVLKTRINDLQTALSGGNTEEIKAKTAELEAASDDYLSRYKKSKLRQNIEALAFAVILALLIRTFIFQPFKIPSGSMIPTLLVGDHLLVNKFIYGTKVPFTDMRVLPIQDIERGDVIVFTYPNYEHDPSKNGVYYIKRVVGLPGDRIDIEGRDLIINGQKIRKDFTGTYEDERNSEKFDEYDEDLLGDTHRVIFRKGREYTNRGNQLPAVVPDDMVFVMGDNRDNSQDSRFRGFVPPEGIAGKAFLIHWSWDFDNPDITGKVRWNRILSGID